MPKLIEKTQRLHTGEVVLRVNADMARAFEVAGRILKDVRLYGGHPGRTILIGHA